MNGSTNRFIMDLFILKYLLFALFGPTKKRKIFLHTYIYLHSIESKVLQYFSNLIGLVGFFV